MNKPENLESFKSTRIRLYENKNWEFIIVKSFKQTTIILALCETNQVKINNYIIYHLQIIKNIKQTSTILAIWAKSTA